MRIADGAQADNALALLRRVFGYDAFRGQQQAIVVHVVAGGDALVLVAPGGGKDLGWERLRPERVCEVKYDHLQGRRFRHATTFLRWRDDKPASECRYDQLEVATPFELKQVFA